MKHIRKFKGLLLSKRRKMRWNCKRSLFKNHRNCLLRTSTKGRLFRTFNSYSFNFKGGLCNRRTGYRPYAYDVTEGRPRGVGGQTRHATCTIAKHALRGQTPACLTAELARVRTLTERVSANALCQQNMCAQRDKSWPPAWRRCYGDVTSMHKVYCPCWAPCPGGERFLWFLKYDLLRFTLFYSSFFLLNQTFFFRGVLGNEYYS